ncbi:MAG: HD domain-containing phosphohydrolase [Gemmatimonadales bacterium]
MTAIEQDRMMNALTTMPTTLTTTATRQPMRRRASDARAVTFRRSHAGGKRVLVADDQPSVRAALARILERQGLEVIQVGDGPSALEAGLTMSPDLVLLDVSMPGCDGYEVCRQLKSDHRTALVPVVLVTGDDSVEDRVRGAEVGADDFFGKPFEVNELTARVRSALRQKSLTDGLEASDAVMFTLARVVEARDVDTLGHCSRLSTLAERLGERLGLPLATRVALRRAGVVHDIGKIVVPDAVLLKRGPLTEEEWILMRTHAAAGERICSPLRSFQDVLPIIRHHHERQDGTGYPDGLSGEAIPVAARVLQVVDVFDALTMARPYKKALPALEALAIMDSEVRRGWWDRAVFGAFDIMTRQETYDGPHPAC